VYTSTMKCEMFKNIINKICNFFKKEKPNTYIKIFLDKEIVGFAQCINYNKIAGTENVNVYLNRAYFDRLRLSEIFSRSFFYAHAQKHPLLIEVKNDKNTLRINNAWLISSGSQSKSDGWLIVNDLLLEAECMNEL